MRIDSLWRSRPATNVRSLDDIADRTIRPVAELEAIAAAIPSMGGRELGPFLREIVRAAPDGTSIVELGSWLGAGTAQLALGVADREPGCDLEIHCFDQWQTIPHEVGKAMSLGSLHLAEGQDTLPLVMSTLAPFPANIHFHKGDLMAATWSGRPIFIHVDDACKKPPLFFHALRTFGPSWIPGETIVALMDFHFWKRMKSKSYRCQRDFIERYREHFEPIERDYFEGYSWGIFRYVKKVDFRSIGGSGIFGRFL